MTTENPIYTEYVITLSSYDDLADFYTDMETEGGALYLPNRAVEVKYRRPNSRNTHYLLTGTEAELIKNDPRVVSVVPAGLLDITLTPSYTKTADFYRGTSETDQIVNWGLLRCINGSQIPNWGSDNNPSYVGTINYSALGEDVDVIVIDGHFNPNHPEFALNEDGTGGSRVNQFDWNTLTTAAGLLDENAHTVLSGPYVYEPYDGSPGETEANNHGCHVAGTLAGNTQGWAKKSNIYNISPYAQYNPNVTDVSGWSLIMWDYIRAFHASKPVDPVTGKKRPTVCNCSYGNIAFFPYDYGSFQTGPITRVFYRGTWYGNPLVPLTNSELLSYGLYPVGGVVGVPFYDAAVAAEITDAMDEGIIVVAAAGNQYTRAVTPGNIDYTNRISASINGTYYEQYCHQGMSPGATPDVICVGSATSRSTETKSYFSNCGNRVDVFAPGEHILSSLNVNGNLLDSRNLDFTLSQYNGTSMASPQVAGVIACNLETNPSLTQQDFRTYITRFSKNNQLTSGSGGGADTTDLQGAANRYLYFDPVGDELDSAVAVPNISLPLRVPIIPFTPVTFTGGKAPVVLSIFPPLPEGLLFNTNTGEITGTPTEFRTSFIYTVTITDALSKVTEKSFYLEVTYPITPDFESVVLTDTVVHKQYVAVTPYVPVSYVGGVPPVRFSLSKNLPTGLSYNTTTGVISGLPTVAASSSSYAVTLVDNTRRVTTGTFTLEVLSSPKLLVSPSTSTFTFIKNVAIVSTSTVIATSGYGGYRYAITPTLPAGLAFNTLTSVISGTPTVYSSSTTYTVQVTDAENQIESTAFNLGVELPPAIELTIASLITATQYITTLDIIPVEGSGGYGTLTYAIAPSLPASLTFSTATGAVTGTTDVAINQIFEVSVSDQAQQQSTGSFRLQVFSPVDTINLSDVNLVQWEPIITPKFPGQLESNTPALYSIEEPLPNGLVFDANTGALTGTPYQSISTSAYTISIIDTQGGISAGKFNLYVAPVITPTRGFITPAGHLFTATIGSTVTTFISAVGTGTTFRILSGDLPPGFILQSNGVITGTVTN